MTTIDQKIAALLNDITINDWPIGNMILCVIALILSLVLCGLIGYEREKRGRNAGLRTHLLVGVGSCIIMIISIYGFPAGAGQDVARLAAQIVTGIGFLGAGAIMHMRSGVKGLTTAATIWIVMAIGIACGSFNFVLAIAGTILIIIVLTVFKKVEAGINRRNPTIVLEVPSGKPALDGIHLVSQQYGVSIHGLSTEIIEYGSDRTVQLMFQVVFENGDEKINEYIESLREKVGAINIRLLGH